MNIDNLVSSFTQKSGIQQSVATTIITVLLQYITQKLAGRGFKGGLGAITSILSDLGTNLRADHPLVKQVQEKTNIEDTQKVTRYTHQAVDFVKQETDANPQGIESLFGNILGSMGGGVGNVGGELKKGLGDRLKGLFGSKK